MNYFLDLFSPETYEAFSRSDRSVSGFRLRHKNAAERVRPGDKLVCYTTRVSRWFGVLEVLEGPFRDSTPIFLEEADPFVVRFGVRPIVARAYPLDTSDSRKLATHRVRRVDKDVTVTVPEDRDDVDQERSPQAEVRESIQIQALLGDIGARMGMQIWIPRADRAAVVGEWKGDHPPP